CALSASILLTSCGDEAVGATNKSEPGRSIGTITAAEWEALASQRVFFGHQSVGRNIMDGVRAVLADRPDIRLRLVESAKPAAVEGPALVDANIGVNRKPETKAAAFLAAVDAGLGDEAIAMYKYCYVDVDGDTDIEQFFDAY